MNDAAVDRGNPNRPVALVVAGRNDTANRKAQEVLDILDDWWAEMDAIGSGGDGFIGAELHGVGVNALGRQRSRHCGRAIRTNGVFSGPYVQVAQWLHCAVG